MIWTIPSTTLKLSILNSTLTNTPFGRVVGKTCPSLRHDGTRRNLSHLAGLCSTKYPEGASCELRRDGVLRSSKAPLRGSGDVLPKQLLAPDADRGVAMDQFPFTVLPTEHA